MPTPSTTSTSFSRTTRTFAASIVSSTLGAAAAITTSSTSITVAHVSTTDTRTCAATRLQVRHWREGAVESSLSKAHLLAAAHEVAGGVPGVDYFPAYELLMDELRDYRWYAEDMLHPSPAAVDFIFDRLLTACFSAADAPLRAEVGKLRRAAAHRPLHPEGDGARTFAAAQLAQAAELVQRHPHLEVPLAETVAHFRAIGDASADEGQIPRETER